MLCLHNIIHPKPKNLVLTVHVIELNQNIRAKAPRSIGPISQQLLQDNGLNEGLKLLEVDKALGQREDLCNYPNRGATRLADSDFSEFNHTLEGSRIVNKKEIPTDEIQSTRLRNWQSNGINLMVDLNICQGRKEGLCESLEIGEMEVQSKNTLVREVDLDLGCISHREEYAISNGVVEAVEGPPRRNSKDGSYITGDRASSDAIVKMRSREARKMLDLGHTLGIEIKGGRNYNLKKFVEMQEEELKERIHALDDFEEEEISEDDVDFEEGASLSLAF
ncbi:hypothetical protein RHGRI_019386 [Rhododendron griersonianum]|uniref:Uncharacterized protein n=1 Tax=Rhododendron griersonianum TaxID=479676 RepID=A0AAV6JC97_9ERIC|nr:hypothetical protein RHGRI_019386 [Rhododendron griersonianum]